jgi:transaldolase
VTALQQLTESGVSLWLDGLDRGQLVGGELARWIRDGSITGVTTNPAALRAAVVDHPERYAAELADHRAVDAGTALRALAAVDVRCACDALRPVFDATGGADGYASVVVDPRFADDVRATVADARSLIGLVDRPNVMVEIPATDTGLSAVTSCINEGISVNVTLIFGLYRYAQVIDAFMDGLESLRLAGGDVGAVTSVASFFVSRIDVEVGRRMTGHPAAEAVHGRVAVANARLAYRLFAQSLLLPRWSALAAAGARPQRPLWAFTAREDPALPTVHYVSELAVRGVIMTMPAATLAAVARAASLVTDRTDDETGAQDVLDTLAGAGVDYDDVVATLERDGIRTLTAAWLDAVAASEGTGGERAPAHVHGGGWFAGT